MADRKRDPNSDHDDDLYSSEIRPKKLKKRRKKSPDNVSLGMLGTVSNVSGTDDDDSNIESSTCTTASTSSCTQVSSGSLSKLDLQFKLLYSSKKDAYPAALLNVLTDETVIVYDTTLPDPAPALKPYVRERLAVVNSIMDEIFADVHYLQENKRHHWYLGEYGDASFEDIVTNSEIPVMEVLKLTKKFKLDEHHQLIEMCSSFRAGFLHQPPFSNGLGREAMTHLCTVLFQLCIPSRYKRLMMLTSLDGGGNANPWSGNTNIGFIYDKTPVGEDQCEKCFKANPCLGSNSRGIHTPGFQIRDRYRRHFIMTSEIKKDNDIAGERQAWEQALVGVRDKKESYGVLLTPTKAVILKLEIKDPAPGSTKRRLFTKRKEYNFVDGSLNFNVAVLKEFMSAIVGVMYKLGRLLMELDENAEFRETCGSSDTEETEFLPFLPE